MVKATVSLPEGLVDQAHKRGLNVSGIATRAIQKEIERIDREDQKDGSK